MTTEKTITEKITTLQQNMLHHKACDYSFPLTRKKAHYWSLRITLVIYIIGSILMIYQIKLPAIMIIVMFGLVSMLIYLKIYCIILMSGIRPKLYNNYIKYITSNPVELKEMTKVALQTSISNTLDSIEKYKNDIVLIEANIQNANSSIDEYQLMLKNL